jgi:hypothetical protein
MPAQVTTKRRSLPSRLVLGDNYLGRSALRAALGASATVSESDSMTDDPDALVARRVASLLALSLGAPQLPTQVDQELSVDPLDRSSTRLDPVSISLAALIVNAASLAWKIYTDLKQQRGGTPNAGAPVPPDAVATRLRDEATLANVAAEQRREIINAVSRETVALGSDLAR